MQGWSRSCFSWCKQLGSKRNHKWCLLWYCACFCSIAILSLCCQWHHSRYWWDGPKKRKSTAHRVCCVNFCQESGCFSGGNYQWNAEGLLAGADRWLHVGGPQGLSYTPWNLSSGTTHETVQWRITAGKLMDSLDQRNQLFMQNVTGICRRCQKHVLRVNSKLCLILRDVTLTESLTSLLWRQVAVTYMWLGSPLFELVDLLRHNFGPEALVWVDIIFNDQRTKESVREVSIIPVETWRSKH